MHKIANLVAHEDVFSGACVSWIKHFNFYCANQRVRKLDGGVAVRIRDKEDLSTTWVNFSK